MAVDLLFLSTLARDIVDKSNNIDTSFVKQEFDIRKDVAVVTGRITEHWLCHHRGDYYHPPDYEFISRNSDIQEVVVSFNDMTEYKLTNDELFELDYLIEKIR